MNNNKKAASPVKRIEFDDGCRSTPKWRKTVAVCGDGMILLPAKLFGSELLILLGALHDGKTLTYAKKNGRLFLPADLLAAMFPKRAKDIQRLRDIALDIVNGRERRRDPDIEYQKRYKKERLALKKGGD